MSKKRSFSGSFAFSDMKRQCFEIQKGVKRGRDDDEKEDRVVRQQTFNDTSGHAMKLSEMREEVIRLRAEADEKDRLIQYGAGEIRRLNAELLTSKHQLQMMQDYVTLMEGRDNEMPFYVS